MRTILMASVVVSGAMGSIGQAEAYTFTESVQFGPGPTDFRNTTGTTPGPNGNQLYYFDSDGGTLNSITFGYSYSFTSRITVTNTAATSSTGRASTQSASQFSANASGVAAALNAVVNTYVDPIDGNAASFGASTLSPIASDIRGTSSTYSLAAGQSTSFTSSGSYNRSNFTITDSSVLAAFSKAGGGTFTPLFNTLSGLVLSNSGGNTTASQETTGQGNLVISFNYSDTVTPPATVPEPASLALLGAGLVGAGAIRRRRAA